MENLSSFQTVTSADKFIYTTAKVLNAIGIICCIIFGWLIFSFMMGLGTDGSKGDVIPFVIKLATNHPIPVSIFVLFTIIYCGVKAKQDDKKK